MGAPSSPLNVQAYLIQPSGVEINWTAPADTGGFPITTYIVSYTTSVGQLTVAGNQTHVAVNITASGTYSFLVQAVNSQGTSAPTMSNAVVVGGASPTGNGQAPQGGTQPQPHGFQNAPTAAGGLQPQVNSLSAGHYLTILLDGDMTLTMPVNPENIQHALPTRSSTINTLTGAYQEAWGAGIESLSISGTTGWRFRTPGGPDGYQVMQQLLAIHQTYQDRLADKDPAQVTLKVILPPFAGQNGTSVSVGANGTSGQAGVYQVSSDKLQILQNKASPLVYRYQWDLTVLLDLMHPAQSPAARFSPTGTTQTTSGATTPTPASAASPTAQIGGLSAAIASILAPLPSTPVATDGTQSFSDIAALLGLDAATRAGAAVLNQLQGDSVLPADTVLAIPKRLAFT